MRTGTIFLILGIIVVVIVLLSIKGSKGQQLPSRVALYHPVCGIFPGAAGDWRCRRGRWVDVGCRRQMQWFVMEQPDMPQSLIHADDESLRYAILNLSEQA